MAYQPLGESLSIMMNERQCANSGQEDEGAFGGFKQGNNAEGAGRLHAHCRSNAVQLSSSLTGISPYERCDDYSAVGCDEQRES